jgi:hypothetical protein
VTNTGPVKSDVTILAFLSFENVLATPLPRPQRELAAFCRIRALPPGKMDHCSLELEANVIAHSSVVYPGSYSVTIESGHGADVVGSLTVQDNSS